MNMQNTEINIPDVLAEVQAAFDRYERALTGNQVDVLDELFHDAPQTLRLGASENLYGYAAIRDFRIARPSKGLDRSLRQTVITTFGRDFATANTEFTRATQSRVGRQTHVWVRFEQGWRIVAAHVSWMDP